MLLLAERSTEAQASGIAPKKPIAGAGRTIKERLGSCGADLLADTNFLEGTIMKKVLLIGSASILTAALAYAYDISLPNLKDSHAAVEQAILHIGKAQEATKGEFGGHADKAIEHLKQAQAEIIEADKFYDAHRKKK